MARFQHPLDTISVAAPCSANWDDMIGTDRARFCGQCTKNVYNLSGMTRREAEDLIARSEGRLCVRFFRRADGTILTQNCPVGLAAARARVKKWATAVLATVISFFSGVGIFSAFGAIFGTEGSAVGTMGTIALRPEERGPVVGEMIQGGAIYDPDFGETKGELEISSYPPAEPPRHRPKRSNLQNPK